MLKVLNEACTPTKGSKFSACIDLRASEDVVIGAGETKMIGLGVCIDEEFIHSFIDKYCGHPYDLRGSFSQDEKYNEHCEDMHTRNFNWFLEKHYLQLMLRSSLGKKGLILPNGVGIIDLDYRDEIKMIIHNPMSKGSVANTAISWVNRLVSELGLDWNFSYEKEEDFEIKKGDRIAQITLLEHKVNLFGIDTEEERKSGFGSTGTR